MRLLILGGTTEASALVRAVANRADIAPILSLAGRTETPLPSPAPCRIGGFGGVEGLAAYLGHECIEAVVDATHPFATRISAHAAVAAAGSGVPLVRFTRPPWTAQPSDDWRGVPDLDAAAQALGASPKSVFLTSGRLGLTAFRAAPQHRYLLRSIDPPAPADCPPRCEILLARPPFDVADETALMRQHRIDVLVTKNSGGSAGTAKLDAARALGIPVIMVERVASADNVASFTALADILAWLEHHRAAPVP